MVEPLGPRQQSLFAGFGEPRFDATFATVQRIELDERAWIDHQQRWLDGADTLFEQLRRSRDFRQRTRVVYDQEHLEPRLTAHWRAEHGEALEPIVEAMRRCLGARYGVVFDSVGFNLYRNGADGVAWHRDRIARQIAEPIVALVSLGEPRRFLMRPRGGGRSLPFDLGDGDLLVTGGLAQRTWEHCVPKVKKAAPRISLAFRHGLSPSAYGSVVRSVEAEERPSEDRSER